jgi:hypothetical protein
MVTCAGEKTATYLPLRTIARRRRRRRIVGTDMTATAVLAVVHFQVEAAVLMALHFRTLPSS